MGKSRSGEPKAVSRSTSRGSALESFRGAQARYLIAKQAGRAAASRIERPSFKPPVATRYATDWQGDVWRRPDAAMPVVNAILSAIQDGKDRSVLSWPKKICDGALGAALALRESRANGSLAFSTLAVWPWRPSVGSGHGSMGPVRNVRVHPGDVDLVGSRVATDCHATPPAPWTTYCGMAQDSTAMLELRMKDLLRLRPDGGQDLANSPTLRELTPAFSPVPGPDGKLTYMADPAQILRRVQTYTQSANKLNVSSFAARMGHPLITPYAIFGLPLTQKEGVHRQLFQFPRFQRIWIDAIVINLTGGNVDRNRDDWENGLARLLEELPSAPGRRPPVVLLADDPFVFRKADSVIRQAANKASRQSPIRVGVYSPIHAPISDAVSLPSPLPPMRIKADFKDAGLAPLRSDLLDLAKMYRNLGENELARLARKALDALQRAASLPIGIDEAREVAKVLYDKDTWEDTNALAVFNPAQDFVMLATHAQAAGRGVEQAARLRDRAKERLALWAENSPVSAKLWSLLSTSKWNNAETAVAVGNLRVAQVFDLIERPFPCEYRVVSHHDITGLFRSKRLIVVAPTPETVHILLTLGHPLEEVVVLGDCAGVGMLSSLLKTLSGLPDLGPVAERARLMSNEFATSGADERLDEVELKFRIGPDPSDEVLDFSRSGGVAGDNVVVVTTERGHKIHYRRQAEVPVYQAEEIRPFKRVAAHKVKPGDLIPVFRKELISLLRSAIVASGKTASLIAGYHQFIAMRRDKIDGANLSEKAFNVLRRMQEIDPSIKDHEHQNIMRWLRADLQALRQDNERTVRPAAARDWKRFLLFMNGVGADEASALMYWRGMILPTRSFNVQEGALFHDHLAAFLVDPEGSIASIARGHSASDVFDAIRDSVEVVVSVEAKDSAS